MITKLRGCLLLPATINSPELFKAHKNTVIGTWSKNLCFLISQHVSPNRLSGKRHETILQLEMGHAKCSPMVCKEIHRLSQWSMAYRNLILVAGCLAVSTHGSKQCRPVTESLLWLVTQDPDSESSFWKVCLSISHFSHGSISQEWADSKFWRQRNRQLSALQPHKKSVGNKSDNWTTVLFNHFTVPFPSLLLLLHMIFCRKLIKNIITWK